MTSPTPSEREIRARKATSWRILQVTGETPPEGFKWPKGDRASYVILPNVRIACGWNHAKVTRLRRDYIVAPYHI